MIRTATSLIALSLIAMPALAESQNFPAGDFDRVDVNGAIEVIYTQGAAHSVVVEQDNGDFSDIDIETHDDELVISRKSVKRKVGWNRSMSVNHNNGKLVVKVNGKVMPNYVVRVTSPEIRELDASSSSILTATNINTGRLELDASSSGSLIVSGRSDATDVNASSSATLNAGNLIASSLTVNASSSADVMASAADAQKVMIGISSSADAELTLSNVADVVVDASSSADLELSGSCNSISIDASSSSDVEAGGLVCASADVSASSSADVTVHATQSVEARASSGGDIQVRGAPAVRDIRKSSGGDVDFAG